MALHTCMNRVQRREVGVLDGGELNEPVVLDDVELDSVAATLNETAMKAARHTRTSSVYSRCCNIYLVTGRFDAALLQCRAL